MARSSEADMHELVGAYALDALEPDEADAFARHLDGCPKCLAELRDHRETAALLAHAGSPAPDGVWERIAAELGDAPLDAGTVLPFVRRNNTRSNPARVRRWTFAVAAAAALVIGINSAVLVQQRNQIAELKPTAAASLRALADRAMANPRSRIATLRRADGTVAADAVITPEGRGYLLPAAIADVDSDRAYQLWALSGTGSAVSLGVLGRHLSVASFTATLPLQELAITVERAAGAPAPTGAPIMRGALQNP